METKKECIRLPLAGLKFSGDQMGALAQNEACGPFAVFWLVGLAVLGGLRAFVHGNSGSSGVARMGLEGVAAGIAEAGSLLVGFFLGALIMTAVLRLFKLRPAYAAVLRVYAGASVWTVIKYVLALVLAGGSTPVSILLWLAYNFALWFGLTALTGARYWQTFLSIVLAFLAGFVVMLPYGALMQAIFA